MSNPHGHFDGLAPDAPELRGWCVGAECVWLHAGDRPPLAVPINHPRPDLEAVGLPLHCGFLCPLQHLGEADQLLGETLWASEDRLGQRPLPQAHPWRFGALALQHSQRPEVIAAGNRLLQQGLMSAAVEHFAQALLHDPHHAPLHERLRYALLRQQLAATGTCAQSSGS